ncbi:unnamed protein product [Effrenium voratum]|nr:unnamed protein product [Effrenium voratum]
MSQRVRRCLALLAGLLAVLQGALCQRAFAGSVSSLVRPRLGRTACRVRERRQARQSSAEGDSYTPPKVITRIKSAASASAVLAVMQAEHENPRMDLIAVAAAWYKLAQLQRSINAEVTSSSSFLMFVQRSPSFLEQPTGREVANILWATARLQGCASLQLATHTVGKLGKRSQNIR